MINNVVLVSGVQQSDSIIHIHVSILFQILFPFRLLQNIKQSSLCYTVGPCWLTILNITVYTCQSQTLNVLIKYIFKKWSLEKPAVHLHKNETGPTLHHTQGKVNTVLKMLKIFKENSGQIFYGLRIRKDFLRHKRYKTSKKKKKRKKYKTIKERTDKYFSSLTDIIS